MSVSKVIYNNNTLIDLTPSTAIADDVAEGKKFYLANGNSAIGTSQGGGGGEDYEIEVESEVSLAKRVSTLPYTFNDGSAVIYNGEFYIIGGSTSKNFYKWNGTSWTSVSTLPYSFGASGALVYNDEIHILGGVNYYTNHYKWNGTSWTSISTLPYSFYYGASVVYNNEIHILGSAEGSKKHYKWNGSSWSSVSTLPCNFTYGSAVVYNNEIHILGGGGGVYHYKWDGTSWTQLDDLPYTYFSYGSAVVYNNAIHILGGYYLSTQKKTNHYKWDGTSWTQLDDLPYNFADGSAIVYKKQINILGPSNNHYALAIEPTSTPALNITANGIYNLIGSKTEQNLNKLVTDLTGEVSCGINVEIDTSGTATADKIASGYTAWVNGEKLTGTMSTSGTMYSTYKSTSGSTNSLTFSNLSIPYSSINYYMVRSNKGSGLTSSMVLIIVNNNAYYGANSGTYVGISTLNGLSVSGSGNSITFTFSGSSYPFVSATYYLYYC